MATARVLVSDELWEQLGGEAGFCGLPWPDGTVVEGPARDAGQRRKELRISHQDIETEQVVPAFVRADDGKVSFLAWNPDRRA